MSYYCIVLPAMEAFSVKEPTPENFKSVDVLLGKSEKPSDENWDEDSVTPVYDLVFTMSEFDIIEPPCPASLYPFES